jgi:hypothetical protein
MNPLAPPQQGEDNITLSSNEFETVKVSWSMMTPDQKCPFQEVISQKIWPTWKLILGNSDEDEWLFTNKIFQLMNPSSTGVADAAAELAWKVNYKNACIFCFNATTSSNFVWQMKDKTETWLTCWHNRTMPNLAKLQFIATPDIDLIADGDGDGPDKTAKNMELFVSWWWDKMLPCATAPNTTFWTNEQGRCNNIHDGTN